jgi:PAS domain S-box-containing protein
MSVKRKSKQTGPALNAVQKKLSDRITRLEKRLTSERNQAAELLEYRLKFESLISSISTYFIRPDHHTIDAAILNTLKSIAEFMNVDHSYILQFSDDLSGVSLGQQWHRNSVEPLQSFRDVSSDEFPYATGKLFKGDILKISTINDLPLTAHSLKEIMIANKIQSFILVPTISAGMVVGCIGFDTVNKEQRWSQDAVSLLTVVGEIIINALKRIRIEEALKKSENNYRRFFEEDLTGDFIATPNGKIQFCNPAFARIFGFDSLQELLNSSLDIFKTNNRSSLDLFKILGDHKIIEGREFSLTRKDGDAVHVIGNIRGVFDDKNQLVEARGYLFDITEHKKVEEQLRGAQKMEVIGRLAGGVAHDFNNILTVINGHCDLLIKEPFDSDSVSKNIRAIKKAGERAASLTGQLLAFSRKQIVQPKVLNLNTVILNVEAMLRRLITEDIEFVTLLDPKLGNVKIDPVQIEQVILNLAVNAKDAMLTGGKLTIKTKNMILDEKFSRKHVPLKPGSYVMLSVTDNGIGMDKETQSHIFEPFYTTKQKGKGTGLGLSTIYGIVKQCDGYVWVSSELNKGTTFQIYFPRFAEKVTEDEIRQIPYETYKGGETILVVEDDDAVRELTESFLRHYGYKVLTANGGEEALKICKAYEELIHMAVIDVVMPGINGKQLSYMIYELFPDIRVLFISGYADESIVQHGILDSGVEFLHKPFSVESLGQKVREVLDTCQ